jgi:hypothetical protein
MAIIQEEQMKKIEENKPWFMDSIWWWIIKNVSKTLASQIGRDIWKKVLWKSGWTIWSQIFRWILWWLFK